MRIARRGIPRLVVAVSALAGGAAFAQEEAAVREKAERTLLVPVTGLEYGCCEAAAKRALGSLDGVEGAEVRSDGARKVAVVTIRKGAGVELAKLRSALARAAEKMGRDMGMPLEYKADTDGLLVGDGVVFRVKALPEGGEARLDGKLRERPGFRSSAIEKRPGGGAQVTLTFEEGTWPTLGEAQRTLVAAGAAVEDVLVRRVPVPRPKALYRCTMDGGERADPGACPKCGMPLGEESKVSGTEPPSTPPAAGSQGTYTCGCCGGDYSGPGKCPKCGMDLVAKGGKAKRGGC